MKKIYLLFFTILLLNLCSVKAASSQSYIDYPSSEPNYGSLNVSGWVMSDDNVDQIKAFIDNVEVDFTYDRVQRPDVTKAITGYKFNELPGFDGIINISNFEEGSHNLKLVFYSNSQLVNTKSKNFSIKRKTKLYLDYPDKISANQDINIQGWILSNDSSYILKTYIDGKEIEVDYTRYKRDDVIQSITGYGDPKNNINPGFKAVLSSSNYSTGSHVLKIDAIGDDNELLSSFSKSFIIEKYKSISYIDYPVNGSYSGTLNISGWVMSTALIDNIKVYIDNENVNFIYHRVQRPDVVKAITGYGSNDNPGFDGEIDISNYSSGVHNLRVEFLSNNEVINNINKKINIERKGLIYIDYPNNSISGSYLNIKGWVMANDSAYVLKTYLDNNEIDVEYIREKRDDVINAISGYGGLKTNSLPGFSSKINISNILSGSHILKIDVLDKKGNMITSASKSFTFNKYDSLMEIDNPISNTTLNGTVINLKGWYLSSFDNAKFQVLIDGVDVSDNIKMVTRKDVIKIYGKKYGKNEDDLVGFNFNVNLDSFKNGNRTITFNLINSETEEIILTKKRSFNLKKYKTYMDLNDPTANLNINGVELKLRGWFVSSSSSKRLQILINDHDMSNDINFVKRPDVYNVYGKEFNLDVNDKVGFIATCNMTNFNDGNVNIKINVIDNTTDEIIGSLTRNVKLKKYKTYMDLNDPVSNVTYIGTELNLRGWFISTSSSKRLQILIDDDDVSDKIVFYERPDVYNVYGQEFNLNENDLVGFKVSHDVSQFKDGKVKLSINVIDNITNEVIRKYDRTIILQKYNGMITVDYPVKNNFSKASTLTVQGWELSEVDNSTVKIFVDNHEAEVIREARPDVFTVYPTLLGGPELNENPGFTSSISLNDFSEGLHVIKIKLYSKFDELIAEKKINIYVYSNTYFGIDVSSHQGVIDWNQVSKSGIDFAIIRVGYGSNFSSQDDIRFIDNVNGCVNNRIPYGIYLYSYATGVSGSTDLNNSTPTADSEAYHALRIINSLNNVQKSYLKLPIFIDMEEERNTYLGTGTLTSIADNFCTILGVHGYKCGVYANKNWLNNHLDSGYLSSKYDIWLAHYIDQTDYKGIYQIWQYSSSGHLAGINSSGLDMNISYKKYW